MNQGKLTSEQKEELISTLKKRFVKNMDRHRDIDWSMLEKKLHDSPKSLWSLQKMEESGGEPDVVSYDAATKEFIFVDCSPETPRGRISTCYDHEALESRKNHKPKNSAVNMATEMGIELLTEEEYFQLQEIGEFDKKTSSWIKTPSDVREHGGAIFGDCRFGRVFIYHNGAESYYAARGFRASLRV